MRPSVRAGALAAAAAALCAALGAPASAAPPAVRGADSAIVIDAGDGTTMFQKKAGARRAIASATKLMTALLALERARPDQTFAAPAYSALPAESKIGLRQGERMRVQDLLEALLLESANDAAVTLAEGVSGSRGAFVAEMNRRAEVLGLRGTSFANPIGLDDPHNYSTARDLAKLAARLLRDRRFARIVDMPSAVLESGARRRVVDNRNRLVARFRFVDGVKTGHTIAAGYVLVGAARQKGAQVVSVVLGEPSETARDTDTLALLRWGLGRFRRVRQLDREEPAARVAVRHRDGRVELLPASDGLVTVRRGQRLGRRVDAPEELDGPLPAGARVGTVTLLRDGRPVRRVALVTASEVPGAGPLRVVVSSLGLPLTLLAAVSILIAGLVGARRLGLHPRGARRETAGGRAE